MILPFKYYMHDDYNSMERSEFIRDQLKMGIRQPSIEELSDLIGSPFYEVTLSCELNTETGKVTILGAET